jgi:hypothetical protein
MDAQDTVFEIYPNAEARQEPPIFQHGQREPIEAGFWGIFTGPDLDSDELGRGHSETKAWTDAARKLKTAGCDAA